MAIIILMPMAGRGSRFARLGHDVPKPLVPVYGIPMFHVALAALRSKLRDAALACVVLREHQERFAIADRLRNAEPATRVVTIPAVTGGALETCLAAESLVRDETLVVLDCDLTFAAPRYLERLSAIAGGRDDATGLLLSFHSRRPQYSYAEVASGRVVRTVEKQAVSDRALAGVYGFARGSQFMAAARGIVARSPQTGGGEYYVSSAYNELIRRGEGIAIEDADRVWSVGTPEELQAAQNDPLFREHLQTIGLNPRG